VPRKIFVSLAAGTGTISQDGFCCAPTIVRITPCVMPTSFIGDIHDSLRTSPANGIPLDYDPIQLNRIMI
jgi:hypothetical protein